VFASVTACQSLLPRIMSSFRERYPDVHIELETGYAANALDMLERGVVEVTIAALPPRLPRQLTSRVLATTPLRFVAPMAACEVARLVAQKRVPWDEVPIIVPPYGLARAAADQWFRRQRLRSRIYGEVLGHEAILSLVSLGCGVGVVPQLVIDKSSLRADVRALDVEPELGEFRVGVCTQRRTLSSPIVAAFWDSMGEASP
jgi:LysR family positive regulator for ilvC